MSAGSVHGITAHRISLCWHHQAQPNSARSGFFSRIEEVEELLSGSLNLGDLVLPFCAPRVNSGSHAFLLFQHRCKCSIACKEWLPLKIISNTLLKQTGPSFLKWGKLRRVSPWIQIDPYVNISGLQGTVSGTENGNGNRKRSFWNIFYTSI